MTREEIRQKAIECGKADLEFCSEHHCDDCCWIDVNPCNHVRAYEHGFADGVEEGKRLALAEALKPYDVEDIEDLIRNVRNKTIAPFEREIANLNRAEWTEQNLACFVFRIQEIIEKMKEGAENE